MLYEIALQFRSMQLYAHCAHNLCDGITFFSDHEFFGSTYEAYEGAYDAAVERMIGLGMKLDIFKLQMSAAELIAQSRMRDNSDAFTHLLTAEEVIGKLVEKCIAEGEYSQGTVNLLAQFADDSEVRRYKIQQRLK